MENGKGSTVIVSSSQTEMRSNNWKLANRFKLSIVSGFSVLETLKTVWTSFLVRFFHSPPLILLSYYDSGEFKSEISLFCLPNRLAMVELNLLVFRCDVVHVIIAKTQ